MIKLKAIDCKSKTTTVKFLILKYGNQPLLFSCVICATKKKQAKTRYKQIIFSCHRVLVVETIELEWR